MAKKEDDLVESEETTKVEGKKTKKKKKVKTKEQKLVKKKKRITICLVVFSILFLFFGVCGITSKVGSDALLKAVAAVDKVEYTNYTPIKPITDDKTGKAVIDENGNFNFFDKEGILDTRNFRILQLTDIHIGAGAFSIRTDKFTVNTVEDLIRREQPDLVIVTGDIAYPVPFQSATLNNKKEARVFATMMENLGIYWTFAFGNHDTEAYSSYNREEIGEFYALTKEFKHCMYNNKKPLVDGKEVFGTGNFAINLKDKNNKLVHTFFMVDSNSYLPDDPFGAAWKYDCIHADQVKWYENKCEKLGLVNNPEAKSTMYYHIPIIEYRDAYAAWVENGKKDTDTIKHLQGVVGEDGRGALGTHVRTEIYDSLVKNGTTGMFCGHDHLNNSSFLMDKDGFNKGLPGIKLTYGMSIDYLAYPGIYKEVNQRGGRIIEVNAPGQIKVSNEYKTSRDYDEARFNEDNTEFGFITFRVPYWKDLNKGGTEVTLPEGY